MIDLIMSLRVDDKVYRWPLRSLRIWNWSNKDTTEIDVTAEFIKLKYVSRTWTQDTSINTVKKAYFIWQVWEANFETSRRNLFINGKTHRIQSMRNHSLKNQMCSFFVLLLPWHTGPMCVLYSTASHSPVFDTTVLAGKLYLDRIQIKRSMQSEKRGQYVHVIADVLWA